MVEWSRLSPTDFILIEGCRVYVSFWHVNCQSCTKYLSLSIEAAKELQALWIQRWYKTTLSQMRYTFARAMDEKGFDFPDYFPGRHWLSYLERFWMQLFPDSDSLTYNQVCVDALTVLHHNLFLTDESSIYIEQLQLYLIENYELVHNALARMAENFGKYCRVHELLGIYKMKEVLEEDGSQLYYRMGVPYCIFLGGQGETEQQKRWRKFAVFLAHQPVPFPADPNISTSLQLTSGTNDTLNSSDIER